MRKVKFVLFLYSKFSLSLSLSLFSENHDHLKNNNTKTKQYEKTSILHITTMVSVVSWSMIK